MRYQTFFYDTDNSLCIRFYLFYCQFNWKILHFAGKVRDFIDVMLEAQADTKETGVESISDDFIATAVTDIHGG